jgi:hypothetical protein
VLIDDQLELGRLHDRKVRRLRALEDAGRYRRWPKRRRNDPVYCKPFSFSGFEKIVQNMRKAVGLPSTFTLDACRHGGMTELEEAELTDGPGRALSAHSSKAYGGYAKRTQKRALAAAKTARLRTGGQGANRISE